MFDKTSRYYSIANATLTTRDADGAARVVVYKERRFIPSTDGITRLTQYSVTQGDRLDNITARFAGDPTLFWRLCDANSATVPEDLEQPGTVVIIAMPKLGL